MRTMTRWICLCLAAMLCLPACDNDDPVSTDPIVVTFADAGLEAAIREALAMPTGDITDAMLDDITALDASGREIGDLTGIQYLSRIENLDLSDNYLFDIDALEGLNWLTMLDIADNLISDIAPLLGCPSLEAVDLTANCITDFDPVDGLVVAGDDAQREGCYKIDVLAAFDSPANNQRPDDVILNGDVLWVPEVNDNAIFVLDPATGAVVDQLPIPGVTHDLAWDGLHLWLTTFWDDPPHLFSYDLAGALQSDFTMPAAMAHPTALAYDQSGDLLWAVNTNSDQDYLFWKIDPADGSVLDSWDLDTGVPGTTYGLCMDEDPAYLWAVAGYHLYRISIAQHAIVADYTVPEPTQLLKGVDLIGPGEFWLVTGNVDADHIFRIRITE